MSDLLVLAFQADLTRIATFVFANDGSNRSYGAIGVPEGHHDLSHHGKDARKNEKIREINRFHVEQFAYLLDKLKAVPEGDGTLLDHCMIVYGSGISDGNAHNHDDLPILLAGKGNGTLKTGRHVLLPDGTPADEPAPLDARPDGRPGRVVRRQHGEARGRRCLTRFRILRG